MKTNIKSFDTEGEKDTYDPTNSTADKETISKESIKEHWEIRAKRPDVQSVMSSRHTLAENKEATNKLQNDTFDFLEGYVKDKKIFELGVGIGRMTSELAKKAKKVVGLDFSETMLTRAKENLKEFENVELHLGRITDLKLPEKSFDLVFVSIVLLHILNPDELKQTIQALQRLSDTIFIVEHTYEGKDFPISKYTILRKPEEYEELFKPFKLEKQQTNYCAGDTFTMMLFVNKD